MSFPKYRGGYGVDAYGRHSHGNAQSEVEPRFSFSRPLDGATGVPLDQVLEFTTYCFSSWIDERSVTVEISENDGDTYHTVYEDSTFVFPYNGPQSKVRRPDGQSLTFYIHKTSLWANNEHILIRFTGHDEFDQQATDETPVTWE